MSPNSDSAAERPHLLVTATGMRKYREYLLRSISSEYRIHLFVTAEPVWELEFITGWTQLESTLDGPAMVTAALELHEKDPIHGVLCWDEPRILPTSYVAQALGVPGGDPEVVRRCRDKHLTRVALDAAGVPQPRSLAVTTLDEALAAAAEVGYPAILKPRGLGGSLGVIRVTSPTELVEKFAFTRDITHADTPPYEVPVLVEEYIDGPEISVDSAVFQTQVVPMFVAHKELGYPPYCEEIGHSVDAQDPLCTDAEFVALLRDTHTALGFTDGVTHTEVKFGGNGPRIIEVNGRLGGDMIPYLGLQTTGIDPGLVAAAIACGRAPSLHPDRKLVGGVRFFYVDEDDTTVGSIGFDESRLHPAIDKVEPVALPGTIVSPPPKGTLLGRIAFATAVAETADDCRDALDTAQAGLTVETL
ncbi:MAG: ATP-grasp domain-containing protein [Pseudonocardiaceae bacterium]